MNHERDRPERPYPGLPPWGARLPRPREEWAGERRQMLMDWLMDQRGVGTVVMNDTTWHQDPFIASLGFTAEDAPLSEIIGERLFCLSLHPLMTDDDLEYIATSMAEAVETVSPS